ncbi:MAG: NusG domain II-containing protein [Desulfomonile tiedjei]|nr:NusG domain II-containing protein [Desulfomonile tiedjei]
MTLADWTLVAVTLALAAAMFFTIPRWVISGGTNVEVYSGNRIVGRYPLSQDRMIEVPGPLGKTVLRIKDGRARIDSSPCPNKICIHMGEFGTEGGILVCVPNEIAVRVGNDRGQSVDAVTR